MKVLYIDSVYPAEWLAQKQQQNPAVNNYNFTEYKNWVLEQRSYLSDYITHALKQNGVDCEEVIVNDDLFLKKLQSHVATLTVQKQLPALSLKQKFSKLYQSSLLDFKNYLLPNKNTKVEKLLTKYWSCYNPDIIFVREPSQVNTFFWKKFKPHSKIVALIGCNTNHTFNWSEHNFDLILSITEEYYNYYKAQNIPSYLFSYGVDERIAQQLKHINTKIHDVVFVGLLGNEVQTQKTELMEYVAAHCNFKWWAPRNVDDKFPNLKKTYQGKTSGIDMLTIYKQSKIVVNDYVDTGNGKALNLRLFEVFSTTSFMITRYADNLVANYPKDLLVMYRTKEECVQLIKEYLNNNERREQLATDAAAWALQNVAYTKKIQPLITTFNNLLAK